MKNCKLYTNEINLTQTSKILTKLMYTTYIYIATKSHAFDKTYGNYRDQQITVSQFIYTHAI